MSKQGLAALLVAVVALAGLGIASQGWRARGPDADIVSGMVRAAALVERGHIPRRGNLTDHNSFRPPGINWVMVPGVAMFTDPRLVELGSAGILYLATLPGVFLIGRHFFDQRAAVLATVLFAVSSIAINHAGNLQPKAYPLLCVWMVYCAALWVARRDGRWLAAACVIFAAGMYVHLEMTPFFLILPALWWRFRPPLPAGPLLVAAGLVLLMWSPYLGFQVERGFVDLESQLLLRPIESRGVETVPWCGEDPYPDPQFRPRPVLDTAMTSARVASIADMSLMNLETRVLAGDFVLLGLLAGGLIMAFAGRGSRAASVARIPVLSIWFGSLLLVSIVGTEFALRWWVAPAEPLEAALFTVRRLHVWLIIICGVAIAWHPRVASAARRLRDSWPRGDQAAVLALAVLVPSVVLLLLSEPGLNRMLGVWPLQAILIAGFLVACLGAPGAPRRGWLLVPLVCLIVAANLPVLQRVRDWREHGWAGVEPVEVAASGFRAIRCEDERR